MRTRIWFSATALVVGLGLVLAAGVASPAESGTQGTSKAAGKGGTLRVDIRNDFDFIDPSLAYFSHTWQMLDTVCAMLYRYPDVEGNAGVRPVPGTAAGFPQFSNGGQI